MMMSINLMPTKGAIMPPTPQSSRLRRSNAAARAQYLAEVNPLTESMGLRVPDALAGRKYL